VKGFHSVKPLISEKGIHQIIVTLIFKHSGKEWTRELGGVEGVLLFLDNFLHHDKSLENKTKY
jgi:hypothetical protein